MSEIVYDGSNLVQFMEQTSSRDDWNKRADAVKEFHKGNYPGNWFQDIILSGVGDRVLAPFKASTKIKVTSLNLQ